LGDLLVLGKVVIPWLGLCGAVAYYRVWNSLRVARNKGVN